MEKFFKLIETLIVLLLIPLSTWAVIRLFYMTWFRPSDYLKLSVNGVRDWCPFANYFRAYYATSKWLWTNRLASLLFVSVLVFLMGGTLLHFLGVIP